MKKLTKKEKASINVWNDINSSLVDKYKPVDDQPETIEVVEPDYQQLVAELATGTSWKELYEKLTAKQEVTTRSGTKMEVALQVYNDHIGKMKRCEVIRLIASTAGLSEKAASTYYQNISKRKKEATA